jgi:penicillin G amidase
MRWLRLVVAAGLLAALLLVGARGAAPLPPAGPLLDPVHGIWSVAAQADLPFRQSASLAGLSRPVDIRYDDRGVPHIFADNLMDATRALGWVVARDRFFQMDVQWRAGAGRLTELVGPRALPVDREMRGLGLPRAAERMWTALAPEERSRLQAFADGVNGWLDLAGTRGVPLEYHLLGVRPVRWEPINSLHLQNRMGYTLAYSDLESTWADAAARVGRAAADALFPVHNPIQEPIQPSGAGAPRFDFVPLPGPGASNRLSAAGTSPVHPADCPPPTADCGLAVPTPAPQASNNWAVAPARSASGHALLAGDPHLDLTLPSIWYEAHLAVRDTLDVYGVTIPGAPGIVIGFNRDVAWSATNTEADVLDRYVEEVDDSVRPTRYWLDGAWRPLTLRTEVYRDPGGVIIAVDTVRFSHRGPLEHAGSRWDSIRWTVLEAPSAFRFFDHAVRARTAREWLDAMAEQEAPAQNFIVADRGGTIGIRSTGVFPLRPGGRGDTLMDGRRSSNDWTGRWPVAAYPQAIAPSQGFLASANQEPLDPRTNPGYLGADWFSPWRALRINQLLRADSAVTPDAMRRFQTDPGSAGADLILPALLEVAARLPDDSVRRVGRLLAEWSRRYTVDDTRAVLYEAVADTLQRLTWDEFDGNERPAAAILVELLRQPASPWWDRRDTPAVEGRDDIVAEALRAGYRATVASHGPPERGGWAWGQVRPANIRHLLRLPALSALGVVTQSGPGTLSPSADHGFGSSWRMVVELGPEVRGWGTYPGGQSGNPASTRYLDRLPLWQRGQLDTLRFPRRPEDLGTHLSSHLVLDPAR